MDVAVVVDAVRRVAGLDPVSADLDALKSGLADVGRLRRWLDGREVAFTNALAIVSPCPDAAAAEATKTSLKQAARVADRAKTADQVPAFADALADGRVSGEHVDAVTAGLRSLEPAERAALAAHGERLAKLAEHVTAEDLRREVSKTAQQIRADAGIAKLERQKRDLRLRTWLNAETGMVHLSGRFDPETGTVLVNRLDGRVDQLFHDATPDLCPTDPLEKQGFLRAHALLDLVNIHPDTTTDTGRTADTTGAATGMGTSTDCSDDHPDGAGIITAPTGTAAAAPQLPTCGCGGVGATRPDFVITIDLHTIVNGYHRNTRIDTGIPGLELPLETIRRMALFADITPALLDEDGVVLKLGRTRRLANRAQRRALRGMYRHCAIPGCRVPIAKTQPHHMMEWDADHGPTDIEYLVPICKHHHDLIHKHNWKLSLSADRRLTITYPDGTTMTTGPPKEQWK